ncbi:hypothetical protein L1887_18051 [Cichorium endivia]|nr:hypothetical protein L1887_18051 [Cichorium endivia]
MASSSADSTLPMNTILHMITNRLSSSNYLLWKSQMLPLLSYQNLLRHVDGSLAAPPSELLTDEKSSPNPAYASWLSVDQRAVILLQASLTEEAFSEIVGCSTARQIWVALEEAFSHSSIERVQTLRDQLRQFSKGSSTIAEFGRRFRNVCDQLSAVGHPVTESDKVHYFLCALGPSFESFSTVIRASRSMPTLRDLLAQAESHELFLRSLHGTASPLAAFTAQTGPPVSSRGRGGRSFRGGRGRGRRPPQCQLCQQSGHYASSCPLLSSYVTHKPGSDADLAKAFHAQCHVTTNAPDWYVDSAATDHMASSTASVTQPTAYVGNSKVVFGDGNVLPISHIGHTSLNNGIHLRDVLVVPNITKNLLSISKLTTDNMMDVLFSRPYFYIQDRATKRVLAQGRCEQGLYILSNKPQAFTAVTFSKLTASCELWHSRLGHVSFDTISLLNKLGYVSTTSWLPSPIICSSCQLAKAHRLPFPINVKRALRVLDLVHCDLWGPSPVESVDGYRYYVVFVDDYSRFTWFYPLKTKSGFHVVFGNFLNFVQTQFSTKVKVFQSDGGTEFLNHNVRKFLNDNGTLHRVSCPYTPQQNGGRNASIVTLSKPALPCYFMGTFRPLIGFMHFAPHGSVSQTPLHDLRLADFLEDSSHSSSVPAAASNPPTSQPVFSPSACGLCDEQPPAAVDYASTRSPAASESSSSDTSSSPISGSDSAPASASVPPAASSPVPPNSTAPSPPASLPPDSAAPPPPVSPSQTAPSHPMVTRAKAGIFKPKHRANLSHVSQNRLYAALFAQSDPTTFDSAAVHSHWQDAVDADLSALRLNLTWTLVPRPVDRNVVGCKWVFRTKYRADDTIDRHKARLVAQGFSQILGVDYSHTFSPVVKAATVRIVLSLAVINGWSLHQLDVNNAFLHGVLREPIYMEQPPGFHDSRFPNHVCRLHKALYGLKQAPRAWFHRLSTFLTTNGFECSRADPSLFVFKRDSCVLYLLVYVDDLILTGSDDKVIRSFITKLHNEFAIKDLGRLTYFLGLEVAYTSNGLFLSQSKYVHDILSRAGLLDAKPATTPIASNTSFIKDGALYSDPSHYRSLVGALQYLTITRPDISYAVNQVSQFLQAPTVFHYQAVKRLLRYVKGTLSFGLTFSRPTYTKLVGYSDADWARCLETRRSTYGYSIFLGGNLVSWSAKKQPTVSRSSCESEYRAMANTAAEIIWITHLLRELHALPPDRPTLLCDNQSALFLTHNPVSHKRAKHIELDYHFIRELVLSGKLHTEFVPTKLQVADIFTKSLSRNQFEFFRDMLRIGPPPFRLKGDIRQ